MITFIEENKNTYDNPVISGPCHHSMARTADKGWSSSLGVGRGSNNSSQEKFNHVTKYHNKPRTGWIWLRIEIGGGLL
jgi:hypothetical protein